MFNITGQVLHVFTDPDRTDPDTGQIQKGKARVQILGDLPLANGETRRDMVTLSVERRSDYEPLLGSTITVPLGMFAPSKGTVAYFIPKGGKAVVVKA